MESSRKFDKGKLNFNLDKNISDWEALKKCLLNSSLASNNSNKANKILDLLKDVEKKKDKPIALIFVGDICAGKTTLINTFLANIRLGDSQENLIKYKDFNLLRSAYTENTFYTTIIEHSDSLSIKETAKECDDINIDIEDSEVQGLEQIRNYFKEKDKEATKTISALRQNESNCKALEKIHTFTHLGLPWIDNRLILCDFPGVNCSTMADLISYFIKQEAITPIIIYVKNLNDTKSYEGEILKLLKSFKELLGRVYFSIVFTKSDKINNLIENSVEEEEENDNIEKYKEILKNLLN
jgi:GTP-binding protein EngB required for normal cell division